MEKIVKDVGDIQSRLIDHRPVLQGEIRSFIREFEEKRAFRECRLLEKLSKMTLDTNEQDLPRCAESMHEKLCDALTRLEAANHMAQRIQQRELEAEQTTNEELEQREEKHEKSIKENKLDTPLAESNIRSTHLQLCAERRKQDWEEFLKEQSRLKEEVDEEHSKAVSRLSAQYDEMKKDLAKNSSF